MAKPNLPLGLCSAVAVVLIWSSFIVFSRAGVTTEMTAYDVTALRFIVSGALVLPFFRAWWPVHLPLKAQIIMTLCGPGALYSTLMMFGLSETSAAYGGVFANGSIPIFTLLLVFVFTGSKPRAKDILATAVIVLGATLLSLRGLHSGDGNPALGIVFFLSASAVMSIYTFGVSRWGLQPTQALALINLPNAVVFLPVWFLLLPSGLSQVDFSTALFHALFQGLGPGFLAVITFALAARHLGPTPTAGFSAAVPAVAALLAIPILAESPGPLEWAGIVTVSAGLALLLGRR